MFHFALVIHHHTQDMLGDYFNVQYFRQHWALNTDVPHHDPRRYPFTQNNCNRKHKKHGIEYRLLNELYFKSERKVCGDICCPIWEPNCSDSARVSSLSFVQLPHNLTSVHKSRRVSILFGFHSCKSL